MSALSQCLRHPRRLLAPVFASLILCSQSAAAIDIRILYLKQTLEKPPVLSNILPEPEDAGLRGAELGIQDNNSAGRFLKQHYELVPFEAEQPAQLIERVRQWIASGQRLVVTDMPANSLLKLARDRGIDGQAILINAGASDNSLRYQYCHSGLLHTAPSRAMLTDALMQFLVSKRWGDWLLIKGSRPEDERFARSLKRSGKRFGTKLVAEKTWTFDTDLRRSAAREIPAFTHVRDHDVIIAADEAGDFGEYILYNSHLPRPVAGTQGLRPVAWHRVVEQWGAAQLQNRFEKLADRWMNSRDYAAWLAVRSIGEAVTRTSSEDFRKLYRYLLGPEFEMAGFKGRKINFRDWNGQMRQPIPLVHPRALVANAPLEGFLHPHSELDTLGYDRAEVNCAFTNELPETTQ